MERRWLSPSQTAQVLGCSKAHVTRRCHAGEIPHRTVGGRLMIPVAWLDRLEAEALATTVGGTSVDHIRHEGAPFLGADGGASEGGRQ